MNAMGLAQGIRQRPWLAYSVGMALALAGFGLRELVFPGATGLPFISFLPAIAIAAFFAGAGPALLCAAIGGVIASFLYLVRDPMLSLAVYAAVSLIVTLSLAYVMHAYAGMQRIESERREELLRQIESRTAERDRLWSLSQDPFLITDRDGVWLVASPAWERILGWPIEELIGRSSAWIVHPEDEERMRREREFVFGGGQAVRFQSRYRTRDGEYRWFS